MAGNVAEWTSDAPRGDLGSAPVTDPWPTEADPPSNDAGIEWRVMRSGSYDAPASYLRAAFRWLRGDIRSRHENDGFRCARTLFR